jgi:uncharacterized SAM-binding protein YcdF (DUF218 family)
MLRPENINHADVVIALGGGLTPEGELKKATKVRTEGGITVLRREIGANVMILSGGVSVETADGKIIAEAGAMHKHARAHNIAVEQLMTEDRSKETIGNAYYTKALVKEHGWESVAVVTSGYHLPGTSKIFQQIYGTDFNIQVAGVPNMCSPKRAAKELARLPVLDYLFKGVKPGDEEATWDRVNSLDPRFSGLSPVDTAMVVGLDLLTDAYQRRQSRSIV